ncbi:MAG: hypothetical protein ACTSU5_05365 [Promethearchaeota archaeon]
MKEMNKRKKIFLAILLVVGIVPASIGIYMLIDTIGPVPKFVDHDWTELDKMYEIGKFHSMLGHGYPDDNSHFSDKHYFTPIFTYLNRSDSVKSFSPVDGIIATIFDEQHRLPNGTILGKQVHITSLAHPSITFKLFHQNIDGFNLRMGMKVKAGQQIGYLDLRAPPSTDIAVTRLGKEISWFQVLTDELFAKYQQRGIANRSMMIKTEEQAQASLSRGYDANGEDDPADWVVLKNTSFVHVIDHEFVDASKIGRVSYMTNPFNDTGDSRGNYSFSRAAFFEIDPSRSDVSTYSTPVYAPFNAEVVTYSNPDNGLSTIQLRFRNSTSSNYTGEDFAIDVFYYNLNLSTGLSSASFVSSGQEVGKARDYFAVKCSSSFGEYVPVFGLMDDASWGSWHSRGLATRTSVVITFDEFLYKIGGTGGNYDFHFDDSDAWWIDLV